MPDNPSDAELVARAGRGERAAFDELVARHYADVVVAAFAVHADTEAARDCAQEAFLEAAATLHRLRDKSKFSAWIYGISKRKAIYILRRQKLNVEAMKVKTDESRSKIPAYSPSEQASREEKLASIRRALAEIPGIYREVLALKYIDGRSHEDIAKVLDISLAAVDKRLMRGKDMLRESLHRWRTDE
ncbi:MAG: RNA polymerase sigma factor [Planctomycetota bacterium]|nr:RNA polymerase sigma factor [Planctomycetota bacterium]